MGGDATRYILLLSSLPYLPPPLRQQRFIPPSRIQLDKALAMLDEADRLRLQQLNEILLWSHLGIEHDDATLVRRAEQVMDALGSDFLRQVLLERLEIRSLVAALRRREQGRQPVLGERWGIGRYSGRILANWHDPAFGLGHLFGWLADAARLLRADDSLGLDRLLMMESWRCLDRVEERHEFGFDAVAVYVMRWDIHDRLARQHAEQAVSRFEYMVNEALSDQPPLFAAAGSLGETHV
jgi:hypothetical protein